jgi:purine-cytosine permease-like protein
VANTEVERHTGVDVEDVPSAAWGWSKQNHRALQVGGILVGCFLLLMLRGNHVGHVEDYFLILSALLIFGVVFRDWWLRRRGWTR